MGGDYKASKLHLVSIEKLLKAVTK
jgi:hypothetical protein